VRMKVKCLGNKGDFAAIDRVVVVRRARVSVENSIRRL
jgi:hypothetical protein